MNYFGNTNRLLGLLQPTFMSQQPRNILQSWSQNYPQGRLAELFGVTPGGAATINPMLMAQAQRAAEARYNALVRMERINPFAHLLTRENAMPLRNFLTGQQTTGPATSIPNVYRGPLADPGSEYSIPNQSPFVWNRSI